MIVAREWRGEACHWAFICTWKQQPDPNAAVEFMLNTKAQKHDSWEVQSTSQVFGFTFNHRKTENCVQNNQTLNANIVIPAAVIVEVSCHRRMNVDENRPRGGAGWNQCKGRGGFSVKSTNPHTEVDVFILRGPWTSLFLTRWHANQTRVTWAGRFRRSQIG